MVSYRFCRPDDLPLIVQAVNTCYRVHFPETPLLNLDALKREALELNLWASSCMVALAGSQPVAVLTGAKRESLTLIQRLGVRPDYQGRGHASHMLASLRNKLAIIGPPAMVAEVPHQPPGLGSFFEKAGYRADHELRDLVPAGNLEPLGPTDAIQPLTLQDLLSFAPFWQRESRSWVRAKQTLLNREKKLNCLALLSADQIEAFLVYGPCESPVGTEIFRFGYPVERPLFLQLLLRRLEALTPLPLRIPRLAASEAPWPLFLKMGFKVEARYTCYVRNAG